MVNPHKQRQNAVISATLPILAEHPYNEVLTAEEERGLAVALPGLRKWATDAGVIEQPMGQWSKDNFMRFAALIIRSAVPLRALPDHAAFREFSDDIPF